MDEQHGPDKRLLHKLCAWGLHPRFAQRGVIPTALLQKRATRNAKHRNNKSENDDGHAWPHIEHAVRKSK